jgi:hypothetical protein
MLVDHELMAFQLTTNPKEQQPFQRKAARIGNVSAQIQIICSILALLDTNRRSCHKHSEGLQSICKAAQIGSRQAPNLGNLRNGGGRGPVAPPVFKTGLAGIAFAGGFDSLPSPPE